MNKLIWVGDHVIADGCKDLVMVVTAVIIRGTPKDQVQLIEVSWFHNGQSNSATVEDWRLEKIDGQR